MRLIDADKLKAAIIYDNKIHCGIVFQNVILHLNNAKTIDAEPVRHGKWIKIFMKSYEDVRTGDMKRHYLYECPICGYHTGNQGGEFNYCPNCGAKMDLEESE